MPRALPLLHTCGILRAARAACVYVYFMRAAHWFVRVAHRTHQRVPSPFPALPFLFARVAAPAARTQPAALDLLAPLPAACGS